MTLQSEIPKNTQMESLLGTDPTNILSRLTGTELLRAERRALIHHLVDKTIERPGEAMVLEIDHIARIAQGRVIERESGDGTMTLYFATRNTQNDTVCLDDIYQLTRKPDGEVSFQVDFMRYRDTGYRMIGDDEEAMSACAIMGGYRLSIVKGSEGYRRLLEDYIDRSTKTAAIMKRRWEKDPAAAQAADDQAREMLEAYLEAHGEISAS